MFSQSFLSLCDFENNVQLQQATALQHAGMLETSAALHSHSDFPKQKN